MTNIDSSEIDKFERMADQWWDLDGELKALHDINGLRFEYVAGRCKLSGRRILDVGCGGGLFSEAMAGAGADVTGIDAGQGAVRVAEIHAHRSGLTIDYRKRTAEELAQDRTERFDVVTCMELLEHVPRPASVIAACRELLRPGGDLFFATINRNPKAFLFLIFGGEYVLKLLPKGTHQYRMLVKPGELDRWATAAGLERKGMIGLHYNPFTRRYTLGGNLHVNYMAHYRRP